MNIFHISAECYPAAKVGGLADVVGTLPQYLISDTGYRMPDSETVEASVIIPKYRTKWIEDHNFETVYSGNALLGDSTFSFTVQKEKDNRLGFPLFVIDIPGRFDRMGIYGALQSGAPYEDEAERWISFQIAALTWIQTLHQAPDTIHCHDHHTALIPFMMTQCKSYQSMKSIPTVLTVHNAQYQGIYLHKMQKLLPEFKKKKSGFLDWNDALNSLAAGLKCCWKITTVSPSYMNELQRKSNGLEILFAQEQKKSCGILNGIDENIWNPSADTYLKHHYSEKTIAEGKDANKKELCQKFNFHSEVPLISFIGRLVYEKGADLLPDLFTFMLHKNTNCNFIILGTGNLGLHAQFNKMNNRFAGFFDASLSYNEKLAHQIYAGSDFMIIPSRIEPCGLNQMYAMRYGTVPVVRETGGLKDSVIDISQTNGNGITFSDFSVEAAIGALERALKLYHSKNDFYRLRKKIMKIDFSWKSAAKEYIEIYKTLINQS